MSTSVIVVLTAIATLTVLVVLLRQGRLREKYAGLWLLVGGATIVVSVWPGLLEAVAHLVGVVLPSNLAFFMALVLLTGVCLHLSLEVSRLEDETRTLAEEIALVNHRLDRLEAPGQQRQESDGPTDN